MDDRIKEFCERLEFERKWLTSAGHLSSDIDIAFSAIRSKFLELFDKQEESTLNAIPIPDNATNGDMIKALFPKMCAKSTNSDYYFDDDADNHSYMHIDLGWWNAKYKAKNEIHCNFTDAEIAKSFIEDVEAVKDLLPQESEVKG